jgi:hypothetical protein
MATELTTPALSAAEKAEQRRQRILAKKSARIAYASGLRSEAPHSAPDEVVAPPPPPPPPRADSSARRSSDGENGSIYAAGPARWHGLSCLSAGDLRSCAMVVAPMLLAGWIAIDGSATVRVSAVELFLQLELATNMRNVVSFVSAMLRSGDGGAAGGTGGGGGGMHGGILGKIALAGQALAGTRALYYDAVLFAFTFLISMRVAELIGFSSDWPL